MRIFIPKVAIALAFGGVTLFGQAPPAQAGFFDQIGSAFGHLGQVTAGHKMSYAQTKPAPDQSTKTADETVAPEVQTPQVAAVPVADATAPAPVAKN